MKKKDLTPRPLSLKGKGELKICSFAVDPWVDSKTTKSSGTPSLLGKGLGVRFFIILLSLLLSACSTSTPPVMFTPRPSPTRSASPAPTNTVTPTITSTPTITPTRTQTPTVTLTPTPTATPLPAMAGTTLPPRGEQIIQANLDRLRILAQWGRGQVNGLAWAANGSRIAVATPLGVYLYDPATLANPLMIDTRARNYRLALSDDGARLAVDTAPVGTGEDLSILPHQVQVWDLSAEPRMLLEFANGGQALALSFNDAGGLDLITRAEKGAVFQRWNLADQHLEQAINLLGGESAVEAVFSPDRSRIATHGAKGPVRLWLASSGVNIATTPESGANAGAMAFSPDGLLLAVAYPDETKDFLNTNEIRVWRFPPEGGRVDAPAFTLADGIHPEGMEEALTSLAWSADNSYIAAGYQDQTVHVWRAEPSFVYKRFTGSTLSRFLAFGPRGDPQPRLAGGGLEIWNIEDGSLLAHDDNYLPGLFDMQFTADGSQLALAEYGLIDFRSLADGTRKQAISGMTGAVYSLSFDPQGNYFVAGCQDGTARLYRVRDGRYLDQLGQPGYPVRSVAFSSNSFWIAAGAEDMRIRVIRLDDGLVIDSFEEPFVAYKLLFSPNSDQLVSLTTSGVNLRAVGGTERQTEITLEGNVGGVGLSDMAYSPGQEYLALVGSGVVRVISPASRELAYSIYEPHGALPWAVAFSPDNAFLAVGYSDGQIRFYWAQSGLLMHSIQAHPASVERLIFSRDGTMLASLGAEGTIRVWGIGK